MRSGYRAVASALTRRVARFQAGFPRPARIRKLTFDAFDVERDGGVTGHQELDRAVRAFAPLLEPDRKKRKNGVRVVPVDADGSDGADALEGDQRAPTLEPLALFARLFPDKAVGG